MQNSNLKLNSENLPSFTAQDVEDEFAKTFQWILDNLETLLPSSSEFNWSETQEWLKLVISYNVPHGKQIRGRLVESTYKSLVQHHKNEELELARVLGWCVELLQAAFLVADDIMDNGVTRRGCPCWYKVNGLGNMALNDAFLLEHIAFQLLQKRLGNLKVHQALMKILLDVTFKTVLGQSADTRAGRQKDFESYTECNYEFIATFKTSYYTMYLPIVLGMTLSGLTDNINLLTTFENVKEITLKIGLLFQIQDDYFDCFGDEKVNGKIGTDIQEGKCTWLFITAKQNCSSLQYKTLKNNYGINHVDNVSVVKNLYDELEIPKTFEKCRNTMYSSICLSIGQVNNIDVRKVLSALLEKIYSRTK